METKLFFHMGPGFHANIERDLYGEKFPNVHFWNQPKVLTFTDLVNSAQSKINELNPKTLVAHSFGAQIVMSVVEKSPSVKEIIFLNSGYDPFECFLNMANHIPEQQMDVEKAKKLRSCNTQSKMEFIFRLATDPKFPLLYWTSMEKMIQHQDIFSRNLQLEISVFAGVFSDYLENKHRVIPDNIHWKGKSTVLFSKDDVLLDSAKDIEPWKARFPQSKIISLCNVGHYSHIENLDVAKMIFL
ncbi:MAG: hypothetical protein A4S09_07315 [Proteobacteria bacterium SG_bin7]|nr:MAG: hypothetical protein A4S09_07315 [Proteobacteria bacterium SG_bin7]